MDMLVRHNGWGSEWGDDSMFRCLSPMQMACGCYAQQPKVCPKFGSLLRNWLNERNNQGFFRAFILFCNASNLARISSKLKGLLGNISSMC